MPIVDKQMTDQSEDISRIRAIIEIHKERKYLLLERQAKMGIAVDPAVEMEIRDIEKQISKLEKDILSLKASSSEDSFSLSVKTKVYTRRAILFPKIIDDLNTLIIAIDTIVYLLNDEDERSIVNEILRKEMNESLNQINLANERFINKYKSISIFIPSDIDDTVIRISMTFAGFSAKAQISRQPLKFLAVEAQESCKQLFNEVINLMRQYIENGK